MSQTKEDLLWFRLLGKPHFSSVEVRRLGLDIAYARADRTVRAWAERGRLRRIPQDEAILRGLTDGGGASIAFYEIPLAARSGRF